MAIEAYDAPSGYPDGAFSIKAQGITPDPGNLWFFLIDGLNQKNVADAEGLRKFEKCHDDGISAPAFEITEISLAKLGTFLDLFLGQPLFPTQTGKVPAARCAQI